MAKYQVTLSVSFKKTVEVEIPNDEIEEDRDPEDQAIDMACDKVEDELFGLEMQPDFDIVKVVETEPPPRTEDEDE